MTDLSLRRAADRRRAAAEQIGERDGEQAYRQYRSVVPGLGAHRPSVTMPTQLRGEAVTRNGLDMAHTWGFFTTYDRPYEMWDDCGKYHEVIDRGAGEETLAASPTVAFLVNHKGVTMARTRSRTKDATLVLTEKPEGGWHDAWLNLERQDVRDFYSAVKDGLVDEMSFAFMIPQGRALWASDFTLFHIRAYDIDRGDVSGVNFGANPNTDIAARSADLLRELDYLPRGARAEALARLSGDEVTRLQAGMVDTSTAPGVTEWRSIEAGEPARRERIEVTRAAPLAVNPAAPQWLRKLQAEKVNAFRRATALAYDTGVQVRDLPSVRLPWYHIREQADRPTDDGTGRQTETDILVYDEIGGSLGVSAEQFAEDLGKIDSDVVNLRINSPGGSVPEAVAIHSSLLHHPAYVRSFVDGMACSAASVVALAGDEIVTMEGGQWMMHDASTHVNGNEAELGKATEWIGRQSDNIADLYAKRMRITRQEARQMMLDETWAFADESVALGLADRVEGHTERPLPDEKAEEMRYQHALTHHRYAGRANAPVPHLTRDRVASTVPPAAPGPGPAPILPEAQGRSIQLIELLVDLEG
jgi:HK97 family phage prohead protease